MQLYDSKNVHFRYIITFFGFIVIINTSISLIKKNYNTQDWTKFILNDYNQGQIIQELGTRVEYMLQSRHFAICLHHATSKFPHVLNQAPYDTSHHHLQKQLII